MVPSPNHINTIVLWHIPRYYVITISTYHGIYIVLIVSIKIPYYHCTFPENIISPWYHAYKYYEVFVSNTFMFPFLFAHIRTSDLCTCFQMCRSVFVCLEKDASVSVRHYWLSKKLSIVSLIMPLLPVDSFTAAWRRAWFTFLLLNHVWPSQRALSSLCLWCTGGSFLFGDLVQSVTIWDPQISIHRAWISLFRLSVQT